MKKLTAPKVQQSTFAPADTYILPSFQPPPPFQMSSRLALSTLQTKFNELSAQVAALTARLDALTTTPVAAAPETGKKAKKERKPKDPDAPKKSLSPYLLFCAAKRAEVPEGGAKLTVKDLGAQWKALTTEQQATYKAEPSEAE